MHFSLFLQLLPTLRSLQCPQHMRRITIAFIREERKKNQLSHEKKVQDRLMNYNQCASWCRAKVQRHKAWERVPGQAAHGQDCLLGLTNGPQEFQQLLQSAIGMYLKMPLLPGLTCRASLLLKLQTQVESQDSPAGVCHGGKYMTQWEVDMSSHNPLQLLPLPCTPGPARLSLFPRQRH